MNVLIIGHSVVDIIDDGKFRQIKPGGIFYSAIAMLSFLNKSDKLFLCTAIDEANYHLFSFIYDKLEREFFQISEKIPNVKLTIKSQDEREEEYDTITGKMEFDLGRLNKIDGILINMITGFDISIEQLKEIRSNFKGPIYFDVHTLSRGLDKDYKRNYRPVPEFNNWAECIDILQTNEYELRTLSGKTSDREIIKELLDSGIKQIIVTKAEQGSTLYFSFNGEMKSLNQNALQTEIINTVGCGDVFGAVYFYNYIRNKNASAALQLANIAAGISTTYKNVEEYLNLEKDVRKKLN